MIRLFYTSSDKPRQSNQVSASIRSGRLVLESLIRRSDVSTTLEMTFRCITGSRDVEAVDGDYAIRRFGADTWVIYGVQFTEGDRDDVWIMSVPEWVGDSWAAALGR